MKIAMVKRNEQNGVRRQAGKWLVMNISSSVDIFFYRSVVSEVYEFDMHKEKNSGRLNKPR